MAGGTINRTLLQSFYQNSGEIYDDNKTEGAINTVADQTDANWNDYAVHNHDTRYYTQPQLDAKFTQVDTKIAQAVIGVIPLNSLNGNIIIDGTITASKLTPDIRAQITNIGREVANLKAVSTLANRVDGASGLFYDLNDGLNGGSNGKIDLTTTNIPATTSIGATTVTVNSVTGFTVGQEVTIFDDVNLERPVISAINAGTKVVTFTASLTKAYKANAQLCRSSVVQDTTNKLLKFGGWSTIVTAAVTSPTTVVASAYDTSGSSGRKLVRTTNGNLFTVVRNGTTDFRILKSTDNGVTTPWSTIVTVTESVNDVSIATDGTYLYVLNSFSTTGAKFRKYDQSGALQGSAVNVDSSQTAMGNCSITVAPDNSIHAAWSSKNAGLPNSFDIRYSKSTDGGVTWSAPYQQSTDNTAGTDSTNPCMIVKSNGNPRIFYQRVTGTNYTIVQADSVGASTSTVTIVLVATYSQSNTNAIVKQNGSNIGRIICRWNGLDATDTAKQNERWAYSDDGGATFSAAAKITSGNTIDRQKGVLAEDASGNIYNIYMDNTGISYQQLPNGSTTWGTVQTLNATGTNPAVIERLDFSIPLTSYMDASQVKFKGTWQTGGTIPVLIEDVRYNITPPSNVSSIVTWVDHDADPNFSITGAASFQANGGNESYTALTKTTAAIDGTHNEDQFVGSGTANAKATLRLTLTRNSTALIKNISQITGAVGV